jgi:hypothetical protein
MIFFTLDEVEYAVRIVPQEEHDDARYLGGAGFAGPDGTRYVLLPPVPAAEAQA